MTPDPFSFNRRATECTRHFVATVYIVNERATALHAHDRLDMWLPPGGHIDRDELPHEAACREVSEETGRDVELIAARGDLSTAAVTSLPEPAHLLLEDIDVHDGRVAHQHVDFVYYGAVGSRRIEPADGESPSDVWRWFTLADLADADDLAPDVVAMATEAIEAVETAR